MKHLVLHSQGVSGSVHPNYSSCWVRTVVSQQIPSDPESLLSNIPQMHVVLCTNHQGAYGSLTDLLLPPLSLTPATLPRILTRSRKGHHKKPALDGVLKGPLMST